MLNMLFSDKIVDSVSTVAIFIDEKKKILSDVPKDDSFPNQKIEDFLFAGSIFEDNLGRIFTFTDNVKNNTKFYIIISIDNYSNLNTIKVERLGRKFYHYVDSNLNIEYAQICLPKFADEKLSCDFFQNFALGINLGSYRFDKYKSSPKVQKFKELTIIANDIQKDKIENLYQDVLHLKEGIFLAKDLSNEPANVLNPDSYASIISSELSPLEVDIQILSEIDIRRNAMNALLAVGQGSIHESRVVVIKYVGNPDSEEFLGLVGKGVTFDTGGISLKPAAQMDQMKFDMSGSAAIVGLMKTLSKRKAKVNVVAIVGLVENMPGSNAQRPGDIVSTMSGKTVEVLNTDAEGRLVLCDCMHYLQVNFNVTRMIDLATLTGAIIVALGNSFAGCFSNDDDMSQMLENSGKKTGERIWRLPLDQDFQDMLKSQFADIANIPQQGGGKAGSCTAAEFLSQFVKEGVNWIHLDIAGVHKYYAKEAQFGSKGSSAFGVKLLNRFIKDHLE